MSFIALIVQTQGTLFNNRSLHLVLLAMVLLVSPLLFAQTVSFIPAPLKMETAEGHFILSEKTSLNFDQNNNDLVRISGFFQKHLQQYYGFQLPENKKVGTSVQIEIAHAGFTGDESYMLDVSQTGIKISASTPKGIFYGVQTLKQLLPSASVIFKPISIPYVNIADEPRFEWRGLHLDVSRHYFPVWFIKKYLDFMAMYKLNTFHWHLTDDQGWRIEIQKYPELTDIASWRDESIVGHYKTSTTYDGIGYGGFYTQQQIRDIVKYAAERYITVIPEIEMPGHTSAVLAAFPELGCTGGPYKVETAWGIFPDVFCAGNEKTFEFLENVLDEVCDLFPSKYIHIGGDECPKVSWESCPLCQKRISDENLKNEHELQSYFIARIEKYLNSKGRQIIGWDEILEGGLAPGATVMSWQGIKGGIEAARQRHAVIMTPYDELYFYLYQSEDKDNEPLAAGKYLPLKRVYEYEPVPNELTKEESEFILGAQGCMWSEYLYNTKLVEYMLFPRICALSEIVWSAKEKRDFADFEKRMVQEYKRLDMYKINYFKAKNTQ